MKSEADQVISVERQCRRRVDGKEIGGVSLCIWGPPGRGSQCRESHGWEISTLRQSSDNWDLLWGWLCAGTRLRFRRYRGCFIVNLTELLCERECVDASLSDVSPPPVLSDKMSSLKHVSEGPLRFLW